MFSCEFCEISRNTFSTEHLRTTASADFRSMLHFYTPWKREKVQKCNIIVCNGLNNRPLQIFFNKPQVFSFEISEIFKNSYFHRTAPVDASGNIIMSLHVIKKSAKWLNVSRYSCPIFWQLKWLCHIYREKDAVLNREHFCGPRWRRNAIFSWVTYLV